MQARAENVENASTGLNLSLRSFFVNLAPGSQTTLLKEEPWE